MLSLADITFPDREEERFADPNWPWKQEEQEKELDEHKQEGRRTAEQGTGGAEEGFPLLQYLGWRRLPLSSAGCALPWPCGGDLLPGPIEFSFEPVLIEKVALAAGEEDGQSSEWKWELWRACACRRFGWGALLG